MNQTNWHYTTDKNAPAVITRGAYATPVWMQNLWFEGEYATYIQNNGCGHCCVAMAAMLHGVMIDPHREYALCRELWGLPKENQGHWLPAAGVEKVLHHLGIPAISYGVAEDGARESTGKILSALECGKLVIFTSNPDDYPDNPFSDGYHWVMAVARGNDGNILIANSSLDAAPTGIQFVSPDAIEKALFREAIAPKDMTWGEEARIHIGSGYVIVG